jgi:hypothetical protein
MDVKNASKVVIEIGHTKLIPGQVADISETLLYQPRVQALRTNGDLIFPFIADAPPVAPVEPPAPKTVVLELHTDVPPPTEKLEVDERVEYRPRKHK